MDSELTTTTIIEEIFQVKETNTLNKTTDAEGRSMVNQYTFVKKLGEGTYGKVKLVLHGEKEDKCAVKVIKKDMLKRRREMIRDEKGRIKYKDALENVMREIAIMKKLNHPNLVKLYEVIDNADSSKMYIVMEYAEKGQILEWDQENRNFYNLHQREYFNEDELRKIFSETIQGLYYLHKNGIVHRDIKPQNILQGADGTIKIADFGVSDIVGDKDVLTKTQGTYHFLAPECVTTQSDGKGYSGKGADIWAMGVTFFAFTYYKAPFDSEDTLELFERIESDELKFPEQRAISNELKDLFSRLLEKNPAKRISLDELANHPFFQKDKVGVELAENCSSKVEQVTVTKEEIRNACTPMEKVVFMKRVCKKMLSRIRRGPNAEVTNEQKSIEKLQSV